MFKKFTDAVFGASTLACLAALLMSLVTRPGFALEVAPGDYEVYPAGANIGVVYLQHAERSDLYGNGQIASRNFGLRSDVGILRFLHVVALSENVFIDPQFLLPFGRLSTGGDAAALGSASGIGDLILTAPIKVLLDAKTRDDIFITPYLILPTGRYDNNKPLNLGEHRWKVVLQGGTIKHFGDKWALDLVGDVTVYGKNTDFGPAQATLKQKPSYEAQAHLRYNLSPATTLAVSYGAIRGGETEVNEVKRNDELRTRYARLTATHWITPTWQLQGQFGRDISVRNGPKEDNRVNLRVARIF